MALDSIQGIRSDKHLGYIYSLYATKPWVNQFVVKATSAKMYANQFLTGTTRTRSVFWLPS